MTYRGLFTKTNGQSTAGDRETLSAHLGLVLELGRKDSEPKLNIEVRPIYGSGVEVSGNLEPQHIDTVNKIMKKRGYRQVM